MGNCEPIKLPEFLPRPLRLVRGRRGDYESLARFHYRAGRPATFAAVWTIRYEDRLAALGVLSWPTLDCRLRERELRLEGWPAAQRHRFVNAEVRTISRVIVHPQFRALGLASALVRHLCLTAPTRYVEAFAAMGRAHPFFQKAGMRPIAAAKEGPVYFLWEKPQPGIEHFNRRG